MKIINPTEDAISRLQKMVLATVAIVYAMPDHLDLVQEFTFQHQDMLPDLPDTRRFIDFWQREIDGPIRKVTVGFVPIVGSGEMIPAEAMLTIN